MRPLSRRLIDTIKKIYNPARLGILNPVTEADPKGQEYHASRFSIQDESEGGGKKIDIAFRAAKTTNDRPGQFVTLWNRPQSKSGKNKDIIVPFNSSDNISFVVVDVQGNFDDGTVKRGQFIFDKETLIKQGITATNSSKGKLAIRVFPPWSQELIPENPIKTQNMSASAKRTQKWQLKHFLPVSKEGLAESNLVRTLFHLKPPKLTAKSHIEAKNSFFKPQPTATNAKKAKKAKKRKNGDETIQRNHKRSCITSPIDEEVQNPRSPG